MGRKSTSKQASAPKAPSVYKVKPVLNPVTSGIDIRARIHEIVAVQRKAIQARRGSFRAANNPRSRVQSPYGGSGDQHADVWSRRLSRELARDMDRNADTFKVLMDSWVQQIAGSGIRYRPTTKDIEWNREAAEVIHRFMQSKRLDARGVRTGYQIIDDFIRTTAVDGEGCLLKLSNFTIQTIESEQITSGGKVSPQDNDGVKLDENGRIVGFNIAQYNLMGAVDYGTTRDFSPRDVVFLPIRSRFSQTRGMPLLIAALDDWERIDSYRESEIIAAEQGSQVYGAIERVEGDQGFSSPFTSSDPVNDPNETFRGGLNSSGTPDWQPTTAGSLLDLPNGAKYKPVDPSRPNPQAAPFLIEMLRMFCANAGIPYEFVYNDLRGLSWSVNRALVQLCRDRVGRWQRVTFAPAVSEIYTWIVANLIQSGEIRATDGFDLHDLAFPQMSWPDEGKEYEAQALGLEKGLTTRARVHGAEWRRILEERAEELEVATMLAEDHNGRHEQFQVTPWFFLGYAPPDAAPSSPGPDAEGVDGGDELKGSVGKGSKMSASRIIQTVQDMNNQQFQTIMAAIQTNRGSPPVVVANQYEIRKEDVANLGSAIAASITPPNIRVDAPVVNVTAPTFTPTISVEAPIVNMSPMEMPVIHVSAPAVTVENNVTVPKHTVKATPQPDGSVIMVPQE